MSIFQRMRIPSLLAAVTSLCISGCIEYSAVVKVRKDGSGVVHIRNHAQQVGIVVGGKEAKKEGKPGLPSEQQLIKMRDSLGSGVTLKSASESKNRSGWDGYDLIFEFTDINQLVLTKEITEFSPDASPSSTAGSGESENGESDEDEKKVANEPDAEDPQDIRFAMQDGKLEIRITGYDQPEAKVAENEKSDGATDPFATAPAARKSTINLTETVTTEMLSKILADTRMGVFVEIDGEIESTNALHRKDNLITLASINFGKLLQHPKAKQQMQELSELKNSPQRRKKTQELADQIDGIDLDTQDPITVTFK